MVRIARLTLLLIGSTCFWCVGFGFLYFVLLSAGERGGGLVSVLVPQICPNLLPKSGHGYPYSTCLKAASSHWPWRIGAEGKNRLSGFFFNRVMMNTNSSMVDHLMLTRLCMAKRLMSYRRVDIFDQCGQWNSENLLAHCCVLCAAVINQHTEG